MQQALEQTVAVEVAINYLSKIQKDFITSNRTAFDAEMSFLKIESVIEVTAERLTNPDMIQAIINLGQSHALTIKELVK